jgi:CDP-glucose 4,6-dehydratase
MEGMGLKGLFDSAYAGRRVLVTGHTGFKGSWLCLWLQAMGARVSGLALPPSSEPAHWPLLRLDGVRNLYVDLRDRVAVGAAIGELQPQIVFHLAAQALVRRSYDDPVGTFTTNVSGLVNVYEAVRGCASVRAVVNATTDKVYLEQPAPNGYREDYALGGHDPYSTSKACAELVTDCYRKSFFTGISSSSPCLATARAGNVIGGGDWANDRLVPDLVRAALAEAPLRIRNADAIRPWQHVLDPLSGYLRLGQGLLKGQDVEGPWNFGPASDATLSVRDLVAQMQRHWPGLMVEPDNGRHPREAATLRLDCGKSARQLGWRPVWSADMTIARTIDWYRAFHERGEVRSRDDLRDYVADARAASLAWATAA